jgi:hypothetical protein
MVEDHNRFDTYTLNLYPSHAIPWYNHPRVGSRATPGKKTNDPQEG